VADPDALVGEWYLRARATPKELEEALGPVRCVCRALGDGREECACATGAMSGTELKTRAGRLEVSSAFRILH
jgi:hypothetical protein